MTDTITSESLYHAILHGAASIRELRRRKIEDYVIVHADATDRALALKDEMVQITGKEPRYITDISAVVALYAGQGCVAVAFIEKTSK